jgi:hypothetical protein
MKWSRPRLLGDDQPVCAFRARGLDGLQEVLGALNLSKLSGFRQTCNIGDVQGAGGL